MSGTESPGGTPGEPGANPQGQPGQSHPGQGQPGQGQPGQYPPPPAGQPGQYPPPPAQPGHPGQYPPAGGSPYPPQGPQHGAPPGPPPGPWGQGQPPGGPPPSGSGNNKTLWIILAGVAAFLVLAMILVVALVVVSGDDDPAATGGTTNGKAKSQPAAVKAYLSAVAEGDAKKALSLAAVQPLDKDFLTDEMLEESAETAKITNIKVSDVANEYTSSVPATFQLGDQTVTENFSVTKSGDDWKMAEVGSTMDFTNMRKNTLPLMLNGKQVEVDKVTLFPGAYTLSTGSDNITYGTTGQLTVKGASDYLSTSDLTPTLSPEGEKAFVAAVKASAAACLAKKDLSPANCPNRAGNGGFRIEKPTIKWTKRGGTNPFANLQPRLDYESPNIAEVRPSLMLTVRANCSSPTGRCESLTYSGKSATVDMLKEPLVVRWVD